VGAFGVEHRDESSASASSCTTSDSSTHSGSVSNPPSPLNCFLSGGLIWRNQNDNVSSCPGPFRVGKGFSVGAWSSLALVGSQAVYSAERGGAGHRFCFL
jgi:hypothetical protein